MINEGDKILINGKEYTLGPKLGGGLEGNIFTVNEAPGHVVKIINDAIILKDFDAIKSKNFCINYPLYFLNILGFPNLFLLQTHI